MESRNDNYTFGHEFCRLLRGRALPHAEGPRGPAANAGGQRHSGVDKNLSGTQRWLDVLQGLSMRFKRNGEYNDLGIAAREFILRARYPLGEADFFR
jgi:hypothetical protein